MKIDKVRMRYPKMVKITGPQKNSDVRKRLRRKAGKVLPFWKSEKAKIEAL